VALPAASSSDDGSFSTLAGDESSVPDALGDGAESDDDEDSDELDSPSSAAAIPGLLAIAAPIPSATANPPTLPMKRP
jgi:hypothetical protein